MVIDPQRDIDRVRALAAEKNAVITHVLETHIHNDYVTGGLELARATGAEYVVPDGDPVEYERRAVVDGDVVDAGSTTFEVIAHPRAYSSPTSVTFCTGAASRSQSSPAAPCSTGPPGALTMLGSEHTDELTHAQYHSVRRIAAELAAEVEVYPTHGFGSFCAATPTSGDSSTNR